MPIWRGQVPSCRPSIGAAGFGLCDRGCAESGAQQRPSCAAALWTRSHRHPKAERVWQVSVRRNNRAAAAPGRVRSQTPELENVLWMTQAKYSAPIGYRPPRHSARSLDCLCRHRAIRGRRLRRGASRCRWSYLGRRIGVYSEVTASCRRRSRLVRVAEFSGSSCNRGIRRLLRKVASDRW